MLAERRYLTIMFADLVGYTALSERLDPEVLREAQLRYQELTRNIIERYGGFVGAYSGDGILAYFGYPVAHENDAERGVRAALEALQRVTRIAVTASPGTSEMLVIRIALHSGLTVVGPEIVSAGLTLHGAVGEAVNLAARLQTEAEPNTVVVSGTTQELVGGLFDCEPLGPRPIRGLTRRIALHRVVGARPGSGRAAGHWRRGAVRMIGREEPLGRLQRQWQRVVQEGRCRVVQIVGEGGIGKSRLVLELCEALALPARQIIQANCLEIFASTPLYPAAGFLWGRTGIRADDSEAAKRGKIVAFLHERRLETGEAIETLAGLLGVALGGAPQGAAPLPQPPPAEIRRRQFELITALVERIARVGPTLLWIEDAHWLDPSSVEVLQRLVRGLAATPLLVVLTQRSFPAGPELPQADETIRLAQLAPAQCLQLAEAVPGAATLSQALLSDAVAASGGIPLLIEQLVISLVGRARGGTNSGVPAVPLTLAGLVAERLDRMPGSRQVVQMAACIGPAFVPGFLATLLGQQEGALQEPLERLVEAEILQLHDGDGGPVRYEFRHALMHRVIYESVLLSDRRAIHARIAGLLQDGRDLGPTPPEVIAHHLSEAGQIEAAVGAWLAAGALAAARSAHAEALDHLRRGIELLDRVADPGLRRDYEIKLQAARIGPIIATVSATSAEMGACCRRGLELCQNGPPSPAAFAFLFGQYTFLIGRGQAEEALQLAGRLLALGEQNGHAPGRVIGHRLVALARFGLGDARGAREQAERSLQLYQSEPDTAGIHLFGQDAQVHGSALLSLILFYLGETDTAFRVGNGALRTADELRHPHSTAIAVSYVGGWVFGLSGASELLMQQARRLIRICDQHHLTVFGHFGEAMLGWALCQQDSLDQGVAVLEHAIAGLTALEWRVSYAGLLAILADAKRRHGTLREARDLARQALAAARTSDRWLEPEALRVAGLIATEGDADGSKGVDLLREAVNCARRLEGAVLEARCLETLIRLAPLPERAAIEARLAELATCRDLERRLRQQLQSE